MKREVNIFLTALMFYTRLPVPKTIGHENDMLQRSSRYFSWIGLVVGCTAGAAYLIGLQFLSPVLSIFLSIVCSILVTGAFHEDGFADVCDAFGGGWTREKILLIMKDSRLGTYGVIGLMSILAFKFLLIYELSRFLTPYDVFVVIVAAHASSRFAALTLVQQYEYVTSEGAKSTFVAGSRLKPVDMLVGTIGALLPVFFLPPVFSMALILVAICRWRLGRYFFKWIGGYTGDCLGATQQLAEVSFYFATLLIWIFTS